MFLYLSCFRIVDFLLLWYCLIELLLSVSGRGEGIVICQIFVNYCYLFLFSLKITKAKFKKWKKNWKKLFFFNSNSNSNFGWAMSTELKYDNDHSQTSQWTMTLLFVPRHQWMESDQHPCAGFKRVFILGLGDVCRSGWWRCLRWDIPMDNNIVT